MTDLLALDRAAKSSAWLVELKYGDPASPLYERWAYADRAIGARGAVFTPLLTLGIRLPNYISTIGDEELEVLFPVGRSDVADALASGEPHSPVQVDLFELAWDRRLGSQFLHFFSGWVSRSSLNFQGARGIIKLTVPSWKQRLTKPMGIPANHTCAWTFGQRGCKVTVPTLARTVDTITGTVLTTTLDATPPASARATNDPDHFWQAGYIKYQGLSLLIRDWDGSVDMTEFTLVRQPPASWVGQVVTLVAGCSKALDVCQAWENEERFGGFGWAMPPFNPNTEEPEDSP